MMLKIKVVFLSCVLFTLIICVCITHISPKTTRRSSPFAGKGPLHQTNNSDDRKAVIRNPDSTHFSNYTTQPEEPTRVLDESDQLIANKQNSTFGKVQRIAVNPWINQVTNNISSTRNDISNKNCTPIIKIVFLKTHKTGSTTMASIFERFGYRRNLIFALPRQKHVFKNSFFNKKFAIPIPQVLAKSHPHFDILDNHAVYYRPEMEKTVPNATYITILRDPVYQLESTFGYFEMAKGMGISNYPNPFDTFMQNPHFYYNTTEYNAKWCSRNCQLHDLGFINTKLFDNITAILEKIDILDKEFDLVLLNEYFDESLILMRKQLCWNLDDIIYISNAIRSKSHRYTISDQLKKKIRQWNAGDVLLYNHFNKTLWQKIKEYGSTFQADLEEFRRLEKEAFNRCVDPNAFDRHDGRVDTFILNPKHSGSYCQDLLRADVDYTSLLKQKMGENNSHAIISGRL
ncbi:galactose-3-O-sulfotransferase 2-like [Amphiura filiformis]|uniref:galactose-3-O-sulfotransferase 2-like n=1 Tax=Amphiura filiformis TaxID=82378 RepID=UPI003B228C3F